MAVKLFLDNILLLKICSFEGFSIQRKNDGMVNNYSNSYNYIVSILKDLLVLNCLRLLATLFSILITHTD